MDTNQLYKVIILGATPEGLSLAIELKRQGLKIALASTNLTHKTGKCDLSGIDVFEKTGVLISYNHGVFGLNFSDHTAIYGQSLVIATGTKPIKSTLKNNNILYTSAAITEKHKDAQAVVYGTGDIAVKYALDLSKKFRYVYYCSKELEPLCERKKLIKLNNKSNIVHLPGCNVVSCKNNKEGLLSEVALDTYDIIRANALVMYLGRMPDVPNFCKRFIGIDSEGYAEVTTDFESTKVPGVFAVGSVVKDFNKKSISKLTGIIYSRFGGK